MPHLYLLLTVVLHSCLAWICREQSDMSTYLVTNYKWKFGWQSYIFHFHTFCCFVFFFPMLFPYLLLFKYIWEIQKSSGLYCKAWLPSFQPGFLSIASNICKCAKWKVWFIQANCSIYLSLVHFRISDGVRCEASKQISLDLKLDGYLVRHLRSVIPISGKSQPHACKLKKQPSILKVLWNLKFLSETKLKLHSVWHFYSCLMFEI